MENPQGEPPADVQELEPEDVQEQEPEEMNEAASFHLSPALAISGIINYRTKEGRDIFDKSTAPLRDEPFELKEDDLHLLLDSLKVRADEMGWNYPHIGICQILLDSEDIASESTNIIDNYGELTLEEIRTFEASYISIECRAAQDTYCM